MDSAREVVHVVFVNLWEKKDEVHMNTSLKSYLFKSVYNRSMNFLRDRKKFVPEGLPADESELSAYVESPEIAEEDERIVKVRKAISELPDRCRQIFELSRYENLKYAEIAEKLGISVKTVEVQMSKALRLLRERLKDIVSWIGWIIFIHF